MRSINHTLASLMAMAAFSSAAISMPPVVTDRALGSFKPRPRAGVFSYSRQGKSVRQVQRAARKARNVARNRRAHR